MSSSLICQPFTEDIRLVIWDLDETFWRGTLAEGAIEVPPENIEIIRDLTERAIMSSICSKNDFTSVKNILIEHGIWDYFIFPDISWNSKGPRIQNLIDKCKLRPESVLFIDDNPSNLAEAARFVPMINLANETITQTLLTHPGLIGKPDVSLTRLHHYQQMETRHVAQQTTEPDPSGFIRESKVIVTLEYDIETHLDRAIELINRTNQLNFCKHRLPEDLQLAKELLRQQLREPSHHCALIHVSDNYGDHGFCGFYMYNTDLRQLIQFCFSCRIIGLGVEQWVYGKLDRPKVTVIGEVKSDLNAPFHVDWINQSSDAAGSMTVLPHAVTARGGCELGAVIHYFKEVSNNTMGEYPFIRNSVSVRLDHTIILHQMLSGMTQAQKTVAGVFGFEDEDFKTRIFDHFPNGHAVILSFANDIGTVLMQHKASGFIAPPNLKHVNWVGNQGIISPDAPVEDRMVAQQTLDLMGDNFDSLGPISKDRFKAHICEIIDRIPVTTQVFILCAYECDIEICGVQIPPVLRLILINRWTRQVAKGRANVSIMSMENYVERKDVMSDHFHFQRLVYYRVFSSIYKALSKNDFSEFKQKPSLRTAVRSTYAAARYAPGFKSFRSIIKQVKVLWVKSCLMSVRRSKGDC